MIVHFTRKGRELASEVMGAVPRSGEEGSEKAMRVWNVAWRVAPPGGVYVELRTEQEYIRAFCGRDDPERAAEAAEQ